MTNQLTSKAIIPILICIFSIGCKQDKVEITHDLIADGCIPQRITLDEPLLGGYDDNYVYKNDRLISYGNNTIEYENGLVSRVNLGSNRYEEYFYNEVFKVIKSVQYRQDNPSEGFKKVDEKEYKYVEDRIVEITDFDEMESRVITYYPNTRNIDTIRTFSNNMELIEIKVYQYDQFNNPQKNLLVPRLNYSWWIERNSENNMTQQKLTKLGSQPETIIWNYQLKYNNYNYPTEINSTKVNSNITTKMTISYSNCE